MPRRNQKLETLSSNWLADLDREIVEQEELIQAWKHPDNDGYQGMLAFRTLLYELMRENEHSHESISENTPGDAGVSSLYQAALDMISDAREDEKAYLCLLLSPLIKGEVYGEKEETIEARSSKVGDSKSSFGRTLALTRSLLRQSLLGSQRPESQS